MWKGKAVGLFACVHDGRGRKRVSEPRHVIVRFERDREEPGRERKGSTARAEEKEGESI